MEIGIYSIFIGNYKVLYEKFVRNMLDNFLPDHPKKFYIVTDDINLPKIHENTDFYYTELIGFPYETLYRFKYFLQFQNVTSEIVYFLNSNANCVKKITDVLPDASGYVFTLHNAYGLATYDQQTFDKNPRSTAYIPKRPDKYFYIGGRFFGATKNNFLKICMQLDKNITDDEKNNYIALWHDESHLNHYFNITLSKKSRLLDYLYHIPEEVQRIPENTKILYLNKHKVIKDMTVIKKHPTNGIVFKNKYNQKYMDIPTFNVLIATVGRPELQQMLDSLSPQLSPDDCLTVVFDGNAVIPSTFDFSNFKCKINLFNEPVALKYWGHGVRNKYADLLEKRDFIMHADDDDVYTKDAFAKIKHDIAGRLETLFFYRFSLNNIPFPAKHTGKEGATGTPLGVIPYALNNKGFWEPRVGGDGSFYEQIIKQVKHVVYSDYIIYTLRPNVIQRSSVQSKVLKLLRR